MRFSVRIFWSNFFIGLPSRRSVIYLSSSWLLWFPTWFQSSCVLLRPTPRSVLMECLSHEKRQEQQKINKHISIMKTCQRFVVCDLLSCLRDNPLLTETAVSRISKRINWRTRETLCLFAQEIRDMKSDLKKGVTRRGRNNRIETQSSSRSSRLSHKNRHEEHHRSAHQFHHHYSLLCDCKKLCLTMMKKDSLWGWQARREDVFLTRSFATVSCVEGEAMKTTNKEWCDNNRDWLSCLPRTSW